MRHPATVPCPWAGIAMVGRSGSSDDRDEFELRLQSWCICKVNLHLPLRAQRRLRSTREAAFGIMQWIVDKKLTTIN